MIDFSNPAFSEARAVRHDNLPGLVEDTGMFFRVEPLPENLEERDYSYFEHLPQKCFLMSADKAEKQAFLQFRREKYGNDYWHTEEEKEEMRLKKEQEEIARKKTYSYRVNNGINLSARFIHQLLLYFQIYRFLQEKKMQRSISKLEKQSIKYCERVQKRLENKRQIQEWNSRRDKYFQKIT